MKPVVKKRFVLGDVRRLMMTLLKSCQFVGHVAQLETVRPTVTNYQLIEQWLQEGIIAAKSGQPEQARFRLLDVVEQDQTNETAWFWLYQLFERQEDKRICLENLVIINPHNQWARQELLNLNHTPGSIGLAPAASAAGAVVSKSKAKAKTVSPKQIARPLTLKIINAFWLGISLILLGGGIIACGEWLSSTIQSRNFPNYITVMQTLELLIALGLVIAGLIGLNIAVALFLRSMIGFYGSLLLGLGLLLVGPTISLIIQPPNYLAAICIGGMCGMVVLLTLASQPSLKKT